MIATKIGVFASRVNFDPLKLKFLDYFFLFVNLFSDTISLLEQITIDKAFVSIQNPPV
jgi:hypothetical protein